MLIDAELIHSVMRTPLSNVGHYFAHCHISFAFLSFGLFSCPNIFSFCLSNVGHYFAHCRSSISVVPALPTPDLHPCAILKRKNVHLKMKLFKVFFGIVISQHNSVQWDHVILISRSNSGYLRISCPCSFPSAAQ